MGLTRPAFAALAASVLTVAPVWAEERAGDHPSVALFVSKDVPLTDSLAVQRILTSHQVRYHAVRLKVRTDRTTIYAQEPDGEVAHFLRKWLGGAIPVRPFDWDTDFEAVVYLATDYHPGPAPAAERARIQSPRRAPPPRRPAPTPKVERDASWRSLPRDGPDVVAWTDLLSRLERLESRALPQLGSVVVLMGFTLDESLRDDGFQPGWLKVHGQPAAYEEPPLVKTLPRPAKTIAPIKPLPPPRTTRERLRLAALGSILTPFGKTGQTFGQMLGLTLQAGYSWHEPWVVMGSIGLFSADAQIQRAKEQPQSGSITLIPVSVLLTYPFRTGSKTRPFVGVGPAVEFQNLSNASLFDAGLTGNTSMFAFGYEVRSGATIALHRRMGLTLELAWQAAEAELAGSREGTGIRFSAGLGF